MSAGFAGFCMAVSGGGSMRGGFGAGGMDGAFVPAVMARGVGGAFAAADMIGGDGGGIGGRSDGLFGGFGRRRAGRQQEEGESEGKSHGRECFQREFVAHNHSRCMPEQIPGASPACGAPE